MFRTLSPAHKSPTAHSDVTLEPCLALRKMTHYSSDCDRGGENGLTKEKHDNCIIPRLNKLPWQPESVFWSPLLNPHSQHYSDQGLVWANMPSSRGHGTTGPQTYTWGIGHYSGPGAWTNNLLLFSLQLTVSHLTKQNTTSQICDTVCYMCLC